MAVNEFTPAYYNWICIQQDRGCMCMFCSKTQIEHSIEPSQCCEEYRPRLTHAHDCSECK